MPYRPDHVYHPRMATFTSRTTTTNPPFPLNDPPSLTDELRDAQHLLAGASDLVDQASRAVARAASLAPRDTPEEHWQHTSRLSATVAPLLKYANKLSAESADIAAQAHTLEMAAKA